MSLWYLRDIIRSKEDEGVIPADNKMRVLKDELARLFNGDSQLLVCSRKVKNDYEIIVTEKGEDYNSNYINHNSSGFVVESDTELGKVLSNEIISCFPDSRVTVCGVGEHCEGIV